MAQYFYSNTHSDHTVLSNFTRQSLQLHSVILWTLVDKFAIHFFAIKYLKLMVKCKTHLNCEVSQAYI